MTSFSSDRHSFHLRKRRLRHRLLHSPSLHVTVLLSSIALLLLLLYNDLEVALTIFIPPSITQNTVDTHLAYMAPRFGGEDLDPPHGDNAKIILEPTWGSHRYNKDAIFAIANTMEYEDYVLFITSLHDSGFLGDLVISTPDVEEMGDDLVKFLKYHSQEKGGQVVVYDGVIRSNANDDAIHPASNVTTEMVYLRGLYGEELGGLSNVEDDGVDGDGDGNGNIRQLDDKRTPRTLGVAQFELFWVWSKKYSPSSRILIVDGHDTYFQENAAVGIGVSDACPLLDDEYDEDDDQDGKDHLGFINSTTHPHTRGRTKITSDLFLYEENVNKNKNKLNKVRNRVMLPVAYKDIRIMGFTYNENVLSPTPTHGHQRAMEAYLRAMVKQFDYTKCGKYQCEWAFHNYLFYLGVLSSLPEIDKIKNVMQGTGAVNSIRLDVPLNESKIFDASSHIVYNRPMGDGLRPSWAVHQYNYDPQLEDFVTKLKHELASSVNLTKPLGDFEVGSLGDLNQSHRPRRALSQTPILGQHHPNENAIFAIVAGRVQLGNLVLFLLSAKDVGFTGDIVLHVPPEMPKEVAEFLAEYSKSNQNLIVYEGVIMPAGDKQWQISGFINSEGEEVTKDPRPPRPVSLVGFEVIQMWCAIYRTSSRILFIENAQVAMFQDNPFKDRPCQNFELSLYYEHRASFNYEVITEKRSAMSEAFYHVLGEIGLHELNDYDEKVVTASAMIGHSTLIVQFLTEALRQMDELECYFYGCNWAIVNNIWYNSVLDDMGHYDSWGISYKIRGHLQGHGDVHALPRQSKTMIKFYDRKNKVFVNFGKNTPSVVINYNHGEVRKDMMDKAENLLKKYMD